MTTPVVQVVTGGTDWPAVVAAISGGIVGLAGIGSTIWVATRSIGAENKRVRLAEKRRIYAGFLGSLARVFGAWAAQKAFQDGKQDELHADYRQAAVVTLLDAMGEVRLIAPEKVWFLAEQISGLVIGRQEGMPDEFRERRERLEDAMRTDLGEPVSATSGPDQPAAPFLAAADRPGAAAAARPWPAVLSAACPWP